MKRRPHLAPCVIAAGFLLGALVRWPYGYYVLLRWVTCASAVFVCYTAYGWERMAWVWVLAFVAVLFNPLVPVHLSRPIWQPIDTLAAVLFIAAAATLAAPRGK